MRCVRWRKRFAALRTYVKRFTLVETLHTRGACNRRGTKARRNDTNLAKLYDVRRMPLLPCSRHSTPIP